MGVTHLMHRRVMGSYKMQATECEPCLCPPSRVFLPHILHSPFHPHPHFPTPAFFSEGAAPFLPAPVPLPTHLRYPSHLWSAYFTDFQILAHMVAVPNLQRSAGCSRILMGARCIAGQTDCVGTTSRPSSQSERMPEMDSGRDGPCIDFRMI